MLDLHRITGSCESRLRSILSCAIPIQPYSQPVPALVRVWCCIDTVVHRIGLRGHVFASPDDTCQATTQTTNVSSLPTTWPAASQPNSLSSATEKIQMPASTTRLAGGSSVWDRGGAYEHSERVSSYPALVLIEQRLKDSMMNKSSVLRRSSSSGTIIAFVGVRSCAPDF